MNTSFNKWSEKPYGTFALTGYRNAFQKICMGLKNNKFSFRIALVLRKLTLQNRLEIVDSAPLDGYKVRLFPLDNIGDRLALFMPWYFEWEEFSLMKEYFKSGGTFLDIGANTGYYSLVASRLAGQEGAVLAIEPNPIMYNRCLFNLGLNEKTENVKTFEIGLADKVGEFSLGIHPGNLGGASIMQEYGEHTIKIKCVPLVDLLGEQNVKKLDFMKIDVEGAEPLILNHFFENAEKELLPKMILIETTSGIPFEKFGYKKIRKTKNNSLYELNPTN